MRNFPQCFGSSEQYDEWRKFAIMAKQAACICEDCTGEYAQKMRDQGRCHPEVAKVRFSVIARRVG